MLRAEQLETRREINDDFELLRVELRANLRALREDLDVTLD